MQSVPGASGLPALPRRGCRCYSININGLDAIAIRPEMSRHPPEMIEVISPLKLRRALDLKDGDRVDVLL
jgi:riboflavin kinase